MPTKFLPADEFDLIAHKIMRGIIREYRDDLESNGANIRLIFAFAVDKNGLRKFGVPAIKHRGGAAAGTCKCHSYADRCKGMSDATITIDGDNWPKWSERQRTALIHHELQHIEYCDGKRDALGRPVLKGAYADFEFDGFHKIINLYGRESFEVTNLNGVLSRHLQLSLPFNESEVDEDEDEDEDEDDEEDQDDQSLKVHNSELAEAV